MSSDGENKVGMNVARRVAMVTGGGRGIGAQIAERLSIAGADVAVCDIDGKSAALVADALAKDHGLRSVAVEADVSSSDSVRVAVEQITTALGPVEVLVNCAGIDKPEPFLRSSEDSWDRIIAVNLKGTLICCRAVLEGMIERSYGRIVNIASDAGKVGSSTEVVYSATKGGVIAFTKALAREVARHGVNVNCVCPGLTDTSLLDQVGEANPKLLEALVRMIPLRRIAQASEIAPAVVFLASEDANYITGQALSVSGGLTMC